MYKVGDKVKILSCKNYAHFIDVGAVCEVVNVGESESVPYMRVREINGTLKQVVHRDDVELVCSEEDRKWVIADLYNKIDMALIIGDKEMFMRYTEELKEKQDAGEVSVLQ